MWDRAHRLDAVDGPFADFKTKLGTGGVDFSAYSYLIQLGYLFPDTAWELAARYSRHNLENKPTLASEKKPAK